MKQVWETVSFHAINCDNKTDHINKYAPLFYTKIYLTASFKTNRFGLHAHEYNEAMYK